MAQPNTHCRQYYLRIARPERRQALDTPGKVEGQVVKHGNGVNWQHARRLDPTLRERFREPPPELVNRPGFKGKARRAGMPAERAQQISLGSQCLVHVLSTWRPG